MGGSIGTPWLWGGFVGFVLAMLALDLGVFHRKAHAVRFREALIWSVVWIALALLFNLGVYLKFGGALAQQFLAAYLTEEALSVDNLFVFLVIFSYFSVAPSVQHRVLFWGILGAILCRAAFILGALSLVRHFHWAFYLFGAFLVFTGIKILLQKDEEVHPENNPVLRVFKRLVPMTHEYHGAKFTIRQGGRLLATPLLLVLVVVEGDGGEPQLEAAGGLGLGAHDPFHGEGGFLGGLLPGLDESRGGLGLHDHALGDAGAVADQQELEVLRDPLIVDPAVEVDGLPDMLPEIGDPDGLRGHGEGILAACAPSGYTPLS